MSNYRAGLAIANEHTTIDAMPGRIVAPKDEGWWHGFIPFLTERYDTPEIEKKAAQAGFVPMFLYWQGEDVFHQFGKERNDLRNAFYRSELPAHHPIHSYQYPPDDAVGFSPEGDPFLSYGGITGSMSCAATPPFGRVFTKPARGESLSPRSGASMASSLADSTTRSVAQRGLPGFSSLPTCAKKTASHLSAYTRGKNSLLPQATKKRSETLCTSTPSFPGE